MTETQKEALKTETMIRFIEATQSIIDTEGLEHVSVRKIAERAGYHNSTIYLYFENADQLILLATLKHFTDYSKALAQLSTQNLSPMESFYMVWSFFGKTVFQKPRIFYNFFFGKYSDNLEEIMTLYYSLFPDEREEYTADIEAMYYGKNITLRSQHLLNSIVGEKNRITEENMTLVNEIIVSIFKKLLEEMCQNPDRDITEMNERLSDMIKHVVE